MVEGGLECGVGWVPVGGELVAEPGALAAGVLAGADGGAFDGLGQCELAVEVGQRFGVADAGQGREGAVVALIAEPAGFVEEAVLEHVRGALGDAVGQRCGFDFQAEDISRDGTSGRGLAFGRGLVATGTLRFPGHGSGGGGC